jgi:hypothetical protein
MQADEHQAMRIFVNVLVAAVVLTVSLAYLTKL